MYYAILTTLKNVRKHPNADRLLIGECFGNEVIVSTEYYEGMTGIYFPTDGQLSVEFATANNLLRTKDENGNNVGGYMDPDKRNVTAIKLRGEKSCGIFMPLTSLESFGDISTLSLGDRIDTFNGHEICRKYIPKTNIQQRSANTSKKYAKARRLFLSRTPLFAEHVDTEQLAYNLNRFSCGDDVEITLKMHGTSQRTAYLPTVKKYKARNFVEQFFVNRLLKGKSSSKISENCLNRSKPIYEYDYVSGTRRTVLDNYDGGYYGSNEFREPHSKFFEGKLWKGESVYYEVVGFTHTGTPIMGSVDNKKLNDKEFIKTYGNTTCFSYGCSPNGVGIVVARDSEGEPIGIEECVHQSAFYVYRMTMTNEDGEVVEYTPDFMRYRCEQMGCNTVQVMWRGRIPENVNAGEYIKSIAEKYYDGPDPVGKTHIREGVVCRIVNKPTFSAYKHKNWYFQALEGIVKINADAPDMEESQEIE